MAFSAWSTVAADNVEATTGVAANEGMAPGRVNDGMREMMAQLKSALGSGQIAFPSTQSASADANTLDDYEEGTFSPTVTLVGGAGNTVPVYSTNTGRYTKIGNRCFVEVTLTGDGGAEGAGTGVVNIALPFTSGASAALNNINPGYAFNNATAYLLNGLIGAGSGTISLSYWSSLTAFSSLTGADQNNATRVIRLMFFYETAT